MLTIKQPVHYGYKSIHDLPTPPSTSRSFPPLTYQQETSQRPLPVVPRRYSPSSQLMSGSHRGLPPPAAMTLAQPPPPPPPGPSGPSIGQGPPPPSQLPSGQYLGQLPAHPGWQGSEESMRAWLHAKAEEEKRRQEEEKTSQERLRLEQRRTEFDILRASLQGGIPPPMVPVVFAGMGGGNLPPAALEWAQQFMYQQAPQAPPHQLLPPGPTSPDHRRDSQPQAYGHYTGSGGVPSTPGSAQGGQSGFMGGYPGSPPRARGYSMPGPSGRPLAGGSNLPSLNTNVPQGAGGPSGMQSHPGIAAAQQEQPQQQQQQSPSIYFHMWQPPTSQGGQSSSNQPATPSAVGESPRKRKAAGPQQAAPPPSTQQRFRSPPFSHNTGSPLANPPPGRRRGHSRQASDLAAYRQTGRTRAESVSVLASQQQRGMSPMHASAPGSARDGAEGSSYSQQSQLQSQQHQPQQMATRSGAHSVSSLLSSELTSPHAAQYPPASTAEMRGQQGTSGDGEQRNSSEERTRVGGGGSAPSRERDHE